MVLCFVSITSGFRVVVEELISKEGNGWGGGAVLLKYMLVGRQTKFESHLHSVHTIPYCGHYIMGLPSRGKHKGLRTKESVNDTTCL